MKKSLEVIFTEGEPNMTGGDFATSVELVGESDFVTLTFGGRDGSSDKAISIDDLRSIFERIGRDA